MTRLPLARPAMTRLTLARRAVARRTVANVTLSDVLCMPPTALGPWQRAGAYATLDKRALLALPVAQLARASGCLVLVWVTNSRHVQDFVEKVRVRARVRLRLGLGLGLELP